MDIHTQPHDPGTLRLFARLGHAAALCLITWGFLYFVQCWLDLLLFLNRSW